MILIDSNYSMDFYRYYDLLRFSGFSMRYRSVGSLRSVELAEPAAACGCRGRPTRTASRRPTRRSRGRNLIGNHGANPVGLSVGRPAGVSDAERSTRRR